MGLTTAGSSTITITKLASDTCTSNITANNTATVIVSPATVGGTVNGGTTINAGSTSGLLTLSGHTGLVIKWQSSVSPFSVWTDIANTNTTYTSGALTETTQFRAVVQSGSCAVANSAATTVTINIRPTITLASSSISRCSTNDGSASGLGLDYTATTETPTTYSIVWNSSPPNSFAAVTEAVLPANSIPITVPAGTVPATYTGTLTVKNVNGAVSSPGTIFTVTINETPLITTTGTIASVCTSANSQNTTLAYSGVTGNPVSYYIDWNGDANAASLADQGVTSFAFAPGGGIINSIDISANVLAGTYYGQLIIFNGICNQFQLVSITILPATVGGIVDGGTTINPGNTSGLLTLSGQTGSVVKWQSSVSPFSEWTDIANTNTTYTSAALTETILFRAVVQSGSCAVAYSVATTVTVTAVRPTIDLAFSTANRCYVGSNVAQTTTLDYSGTTESPITYSIVWYFSPANSFIDVIDASLPASPITIAIPAGTNPGTYTGMLTVKNANGAVSDPSSLFTVNLGSLASILTDGAIAPVTTSSSPQATTLAYSGLFPSSATPPTKYFIDWDQTSNSALLVDQPTTSFAFSSGGGSINNIVIPANVPAGTYTGTMYISTEISCNQGQNVSITVAAPVAPTIALASSAENICFTEEAYTMGHTTLSYEGTTGNPTTYSIVWDSSPSNFFEDVTNAVLPASPIPITSDYENSGTYTGTLTVKDANGVSSAGSIFSVTIGFKSLIVINEPIHSVCLSANAQLTTLAYNNSSSFATSYYIDWDQAANTASLQDQPSTPNNFSTGGVINTIQVSAKAKAGTYSGTLYIVDGSCSTSHAVSLTINALPNIRLATPSVINVCSTATSQTTDLIYTQVFENPTTYSIVWDSSPANSFVAVTDAVLPASPIQISIPAGIAPGTYTGRITVTNAIGCEIPGPGSEFEINVNPAPTALVIGEITPEIDESELGSIALSGFPEGDYTILIVQTEQTYTGSGEDQIIENIPSGEYSFIVTNAAGCSSPESEIAVVPGFERRTIAKPITAPATEGFDALKNPITVSALNKVITVDTPNQIIDKVYVFNVSGNLIYEKSGVSDAKLVITDLRSSNQVLVVKVIFNDNHSETRKVIF